MLGQQSFRDFLLDKQRCLNPKFRISQESADEAVMEACLHTLSNTLHEDFYGLSDPSTLSTTIEAKDPPSHVLYASLYWVDHLKRSALEPGDGGSVHEFLNSHFLYWLEFLSASHRMSQAVLAVTNLADFISSLPVCDTFSYNAPSYN
ncbi:hypothetical protein BDV59DRAFT_167465 [Aspergillus ambiguus]|uniref:uncharacterized protein n=1 Tax=Aspergillus ambiguus TaxID=176160 RepID=UPI003CCCB758